MSVLDQSIIAEVRETLGDDIFKGFADRMLAEAVQTVGQLRGLLASGETEALAQLAHRSAGSAVSVGASALHARLKRTPRCDGNIAEAQAALDSLLG